jgi:predicted transcriptional regulator
MSAPCEVAVKCALPSVRAMIAKELMAKHGLKQADAARLLGVSQPAISLYYREMRGKAVNLEGDSDVRGLIIELARRLSEGNLSHLEFMSKLCQICRKMRAKGLLCAMHKTFDPAVDVGHCELCASIDLLKCI